MEDSQSTSTTDHRTQEDDGEIIYYGDGGVDEFSQSQTRILRWTFPSQSQSQLSHSQHPPPATAGAAMSVLPRSERRRMRGESEPADDGMETDEDGCQDHFSSDSDSGGDGQGRRAEAANFGSNAALPGSDDKEEEDDEFASIHSYLDKQKTVDEDGETKREIITRLHSLSGSSQNDGREQTNAKESADPGPEVEACDTIGNKKDHPIEQNSTRSTCNDKDSMTLTHEYLGSDQDGSHLGGIDMNRLRRQSTKRLRYVEEKIAKRRKKILTEDLTELTNTDHNEVLLAARREHQQLAAIKPRSRNVRKASPTYTAPGVKKAKSGIVGSRPTHWGAGGRESARAQTSSLGQKKKLSEAARMRTTNRLGTQQKCRGDGNRRTSLHHGDSIDRRQNSNGKALLGSENDHSGSPEDGSSASKWEQNINVRNMQFAPAFISRPPGEINDDGDEVNPLSTSMTPNADRSKSSSVTPVRFSLGVSNNAAALASSIGSTPGLSSTKRKGKRLNAGPLMSTLRDIRATAEGDRVRLNVVPPGRRKDVSDPRNRASSFMDATLVGKIIPWTGRIQKGTALGYIHSHVLRKRKEPNNIAPSQNAKHSFEDPITDVPAWLCFDYGIINEMKLEPGCQLRIYDAIVLPSRHPEDSERCKPTDLPVVLCTNLCELYPEHLPPLAAAPVQMG